MDDFIFTAYDMALLYNCKLLVRSIRNIKKSDFPVSSIKDVLAGVLVNSSILDNLTKTGDAECRNVCIQGCYFSFDNSGERIYLGYAPELFLKNIISKKNPVENYLYCVALNKNLVDMDKARNADFCLTDDGLIYFSLVNRSLSGLLNNNHCTGESVNGELNLDISHSLVLVQKLFSLIYSSNDEIISRLNKAFGQPGLFSTGDDYYYKGSLCGKYIRIGEDGGSLYFGLSPNVFDETAISPQSAIVSDYFSSVAILNDHVSPDSKSDLIKNGAEFGGTWCYFPICRKLLCCDNFRELYINRVVNIIVEGLKI